MIRIIENIKGFSEIIPTREQVLEVMSKYVNNIEIVIEKEDERGLFLMEVMVSGDNPNEMYLYSYMRKGEYEGIGGSSDTIVFVSYFKNGTCMGGNAVSKLNEETGEWINLGHIIKNPKLN